MADLVFYHASPSRSSIVLWLLEELGVEYELRLLSFERGEHKEAGYLAVNPFGKVPTIVDRGTVVTEAAAICCHLAERFPEAGLDVPVGDPRRGAYLRWLFMGPGVFEPAIMDRLLKRPEAPASALGYGTFDTVMDVTARAVEPGPHLLGEPFTAADVLIGSTLRWGMAFGGVPARPEIKAYVDRLAARPAAQRAEAKEKRLQGAAG